MKFRLMALAVPVLIAACADASRTPTQPETEGAALVAGRMATVTQSYASGTTPVTAYDPIFPDEADLTWPATSCTATPAVGLNADWQNPHPAVTGLSHPWINDWFSGAGWINAWGVSGQQPPSQGPGGQSWTKYTTQVQGNGAFVIQLLADNCSWIYLDNTLVGVQNTNPSTVSYGLSLNGTHTLTFIIFDGGGLAGGKFKLATTTNPPPPLNNDLDDDGYQNNDDDFPLDPTRWDASNLIANGSFERPVIGAGPWPLGPVSFPWQTFNSADQGLTGWTVESNSADTQSGETAFQFTGVPDGVQVLDLNSATVSQGVATQANYKYRVSFALSRNYTCAGSARVRVAFGDASQEFTHTAGGSASSMVWDAHSIEGVASGTSETLRFTATAAGGCGGPMLDAVRIESLGLADNTPPSIVASITGTLGSNGWYTSDVGVTWASTDGESAITSVPCAASSVTTDTDTDGVTFTCSATSQGGTASESVTIKRDATAPTVIAAISAGTMGTNGWYTSPVTVGFTCNDGGSGVATCAADQTLSNQGANTSAAGTATDAAGNSSGPSNTVSVNIDGVKPVITFSGNAGSYSVDQQVSIACSATDATSGIASSTCPIASGAAYTFSVGSHTLNASATDKAGNQHAASTSFTVTVNSGNICELVKRWVSNAGVANSMCVKLRQGSYGAFRNELSAQGGKKFLSEANAAILLRLVNLLG